MMWFLTPGIPLSAKGNLIQGLSRVKELGLDGMELEFVRSVFLRRESALKVKTQAEELDLKLTVHAPYYINLNTADRVKLEQSIGRIVLSAEIGYFAGAKSCCFHPAYYGKLTREATYDNVKKAFQKVINILADKKVRINLAPETMGRPSQFGTLEELLKLCTDVELPTGITSYPCIDFSHLYAREGKINGYREFRRVLEEYESVFGKAGLKNMHVHLQGIAFGQKGEKNHTLLSESDLKYEEVLHTLKEFNAYGYLVCESPNVEQDTLLLKQVFRDKVSR